MEQQPIDTQINEEWFRAYEYYFRELLTARFYRNVFNFVCFAQLILGSAFMANIASWWVAGFITTTLSAYIFVYNPGAIASAAKRQSARYEKILHQFHEFTPDDVATQFSRLSETDSPVPESLVLPAYFLAYCATCRTLTDPEAERQADKIKRNLTCLERVYAFIAGSILRSGAKC